MEKLLKRNKNSYYGGGSSYPDPDKEGDLSDLLDDNDTYGY